MANRKSAGPAGPGEVKAAWFMPEQLARVPIDELVPYARNARTHSESQIAQIRASLREFGFVNPVLIDSDRNIIAGHGRVLAAQAEGMTEVPCVLVEHLTDAQVYVHVWDALMRLQDVLPRAFMYYGKMQVNGQETGSEELGIFLPLRHFGDAMERNIEQADGIALGFREEMERYVRSV